MHINGRTRKTNTFNYEENEILHCIVALVEPFKTEASSSYFKFLYQNLAGILALGLINHLSLFH